MSINSLIYYLSCLPPTDTLCWMRSQSFEKDAAMCCCCCYCCNCWNPSDTCMPHRSQRPGAVCVPVVAWVTDLTLQGSSSLGAGPALAASGGSTEAFMLFNYRCSHNTSSTFYCSSSTKQEITTKPWHCPQVEMFGNSSVFPVIGTNLDSRWLIVIHEPTCNFFFFFFKLAVSSDSNRPFS